MHKYVLSYEMYKYNFVHSYMIQILYFYLNKPILVFIDFFKKLSFSA